MFPTVALQSPRPNRDGATKPPQRCPTSPARVRPRRQGVPHPQRRGRLARFVAVAIACIAAAAAVGPVAADGGAPAQTFAQIVGKAKLVVVARIDIGPDGGVTLDVERVLKGPAVARLVFPPTDIAPPLDGMYSGTKFALEGLSEALKREVEHFGIKVAIIEPGFFQTTFSDNAQLGAAQNVAFYRDPTVDKLLLDAQAAGQQAR